MNKRQRRVFTAQLPYSVKREFPLLTIAALADLLKRERHLLETQRRSSRPSARLCIAVAQALDLDASTLWDILHERQAREYLQKLIGKRWTWTQQMFIVKLLPSPNSP